MSYESRSISDDNNYTTTVYQRNTHFGSPVQYTSSMAVNIRQLQTDLQKQHKYEKDELTELNQRFHLFVDRIQLLQSQNLKYCTAIADIRREFSGISSSDVQWEENYFSLQTNLSTVRYAIVDYQWDFELYQLQIGIYQQLIEIEQQPKNKRISILEEELKQSAAALNSLRISYEELQQTVEHLHVESENLFKQYLTLTHDWCHAIKQRQKWDLNMDALKSYIVFYKNLRSYSMQESDSLSIQTDDMTQFWTLELGRVVTKIRRDFEAFYTRIHQQMVAYYQTKTEELETYIKQDAQYEQIDIEQFTVTQQKLTIEYEQEQKTLSYEKEIFFKLESTYSKLGAEFQSIQVQNEERFEMQSNDLQTLEESFMIMAYDVDELRRSKASLEVEIIIYRQLLDASGVEVPPAFIPRIQTVEAGIMRRTAIEKQERGPIGIKECAPNGTYISLVNYSTNNTIDISKWILTKQHINSEKKLRYIIPNGIRLEPGRELRIYGKINSGAAGESTSYQKLVNNDLVSWGDGNSIETNLFNQNGEEESFYTQLIVF